MHLTPVERQHFPAWKQLRAAVYTNLDEAFCDREMEWIFASPDKRCWILWTDAGEPVGLLEVSLRNVVDGCVGSPVGYIEGMYIAPQWRGAGHGRGMIVAAEAWFRSQGCRDMATDAELDNHAAQEFFRRHGFFEGWRIVEFRKPLDPE